MTSRQVLPIALALCLARCGTQSPSGDSGIPPVTVDGGNDSGDSGNDSGVLRTTFGGERPVELQVPVAYRPDQKWPLVLFLHGYSSSASNMLRYSKMDRLVDEVGILMIAPNGTEDTVGLRFWNATDFCCDFSGRGVDDVGYLIGLVAEVAEVYEVDPARIFIWGHSNGGFMAHRLACDYAETFASIISFAGSTSIDETHCKPTEPVSVLQIHGTQDEVISYTGSPEKYPSAEETFVRWAALNECDGGTRNMGSLDFTPDVQGTETTQTTFEGCPPGIDVDLWSSAGATHFPSVTDSFRALMWDWFEAHPKP